MKGLSVISQSPTKVLYSSEIISGKQTFNLFATVFAMILYRTLWRLIMEECMSFIYYRRYTRHRLIDGFRCANLQVDCEHEERHYPP